MFPIIVIGIYEIKCQIPVRTVSVQAQIRTAHFPNTSQKCSPCEPVYLGTAQAFLKTRRNNEQLYCLVVPLNVHSSV